MADRTGIAWADATWNPVTGCSPISEGCKHCYAKFMTKRFPGIWPDGFKVTLHLARLDEPMHWRKRRRVLVCSMGDLFHEDVDVEWTLAILLMIRKTLQKGLDHIFFLLTKRPGIAHAALTRIPGWPTDYPHVWLGVTAENQARADERIPILLDTPAMNRFVSCEPLLERVSLWPYLNGGGLGWVIVGGESGPGHRLMNEDWARMLRDDCKEADTPFHFKQHSGPRPGFKPELDGVKYMAKPPFEYGR